MMTPARLKKYALTYHQAERVRHARPPKWETDPAAVEAGIEWRGPGQTTLQNFGLQLAPPRRNFISNFMWDVLRHPDTIYCMESGC